MRENQRGVNRKTAHRPRDKVRFKLVAIYTCFKAHRKDAKARRRYFLLFILRHSVFAPLR
jgi:hypothetical protein